MKSAISNNHLDFVPSRETTAEGVQNKYKDDEGVKFKNVCCCGWMYFGNNQPEVLAIKTEFGARGEIKTLYLVEGWGQDPFTLPKKVR